MTVPRNPAVGVTEKPQASQAGEQEPLGGCTIALTGGTPRNRNGVRIREYIALKTGYGEDTASGGYNRRAQRNGAGRPWNTARTPLRAVSTVRPRRVWYEAPIDEEAKKYNQNLSGMGGVFNYINLHAYHYAGNNPVKHTDPTGAYDFDHENKIIYTDLTIKDLDAANTIFAGYQQFGYKVVALDDEGKAFLDLDGFGWSTGGSAGEGVYVGGDINLGKYPGGSFSFGLTARVPAEGHSGPSVFFVYPKDK